MKKSIYYFLTSLFFISCTGEGLLPLVPDNPNIPRLSYPLNNETCLDATPVSDTQSSVNFYWRATKDTENYELHILNLENNETFTVNLQENPPVEVTLTKNNPYQWYVVANGAPSTSPSQSESWRFYLAGESVQNFSPFPSTLVYPPASATINANNNGEVALEWFSTDVDNDLANYKLYMDQADASTLITTLDYTSGNMSYNLPIDSGSTYYWRVVAEDANGNRSDSGINGFRVN